MGRKESKAWVCIHSICAAHHIDEENLCKRAKLLLSSFSNLYWSRVPGNRWGEKPMTYEDRIRLKEAFHYLKEFSATEEKQSFLTRISTYKVWVQLRQTATGSLLWVQSKLLLHTVASEAFSIFDPGPLRKIPDTPKGVSGILVPVTGVG